MNPECGGMAPLFLERKIVEHSEINGPHGNDSMAAPEWILTVGVFAGEELEHLVEQYDRQGHLQHGDPFIDCEGANLEDGRQDLDVQNDEVERHGQGHGSKQPEVGPWGHNQHRLVLRQAVQSVQHLNGDQHGQGHGHGVGVVEDAAVHSLETKQISLLTSSNSPYAEWRWNLEVFVVGRALQVMAQLVVGHLGSSGADEVPPGRSTDRGGADVGSDGHVTEEQPSGDETFSGATRRLVHDVQIGGVEAEGGGGKTISDQVHPQELHGDQSLRETQSGSQENTHNLNTSKQTNKLAKTYQ